MTNETTASQPKSIGDDAQFYSLLRQYVRSCNNGWMSDAEVDSDKALLVAYVENLIDSRAPAAQASATIQAATLPAERAPNSSDTRDEAHAAGWNACLAAIRDAAPMVADPAGVAKPCGWLAGNSSDGGEFMYWHREDAQRECDDHNTYERSRTDFAPEALREPEPVYSAATVKAVPSEALDDPVKALSKRLFAAGVTKFGFTRGEDSSATAEQIAAAINTVLDVLESDAAPLADKKGGGE